MAENSILSPVSLTSFFDNATGAARQANLFFYRAQTLDPIVVYTDSGLGIPFPQPVVTTGWGRVPPVYVGEIPAPGYRVRAFDQYQTLIEDLDGLPGAEPDAASVAPPTPVKDSQLAAIGDIKLMWANHRTLIGWVECDGKTIGNPLSGATGRANDDTHDLFIWLWENDAIPTSNPPGVPLLPVLPNKGGSAQGDWDLNKQITLPDFRARFLMGLDGHDTANNAATAKRADKGKWDLVPGSTTEYQKPWQIGAAGGEDVHKLVVTELAVHKHDWADTKGHTHYVWEPDHGGGVRGHAHNITNVQHQHDMRMPVGNTTYQNDATPEYALVRVGTQPAGMSLGYTGRVLVASSQSAADGNTALAYANITATLVGPTGIVLCHSNYAGTAGTPGVGSIPMYIGTWVPPNAAAPDGSIEKTGYYSNPTENNPRADTYFDAAQRGDKPHNTLPPFATVAIYIYYGEPATP